MRTWRRTPIATVCGRCSALISPGTSLLEVTLPHLRHVKVRCGACAGEPVPDLPAFVDRHTEAEPARLVRLLEQIEPLPWDFKTAQAGVEERE